MNSRKLARVVPFTDENLRAASADGSAFVTPELPLNCDFAVRIWTVE